MFKEIIIPILIEECKNKNAKYICWIGQFEHFFYSDYSLTTIFLKAINKEGYFSSIIFFEEAYKIEKRKETLDLLLNRIAQDLDYYIHEVPFGIIVEPEVFDEEVGLFKKYYNLLDDKSLWTSKLEEWGMLAFHWKKQLSNRNRYSNFEDYLTKNGILYE